MMLYCAIVLLVYGLMVLWLQANRAALHAKNTEAQPKIVHVVYVPTTHVVVANPSVILQDGAADRALAQVTPLAYLPVYVEPWVLQNKE